MQKEPKFLTITQAAEILRISPDTLRRWEDRGIVTPHRTRGGSRRYTLLDLKIAKLNRKKNIKNYINSSPPAIAMLRALRAGPRLKIALLTSFFWIFAFLVFYFVIPIFMRPTNPEQQINTFLNKKNLTP